MLVCSPMVIGAMSPRTTVLYQMEESRPNVTSPRTTAPGAMKAVGWITVEWGLLFRPALDGYPNPPFNRPATLRSRTERQAPPRPH